MRRTVCLLIILLSGCHGVPLLEQATGETPPSIMLLWERYQQCLVTNDPTELVLIIEQFEREVSERAELPSWMKGWGDHVTNQPLRTVVDPRALGAACTLRAAALMVEAQHLMGGRVLYQRVLARYSNRDWAYYVDRAKEALVRSLNAQEKENGHELHYSCSHRSGHRDADFHQLCRIGQTLFITGGSAVYRLRLTTSGAQY